ncbi:Transposon Ty3-G Gag-Pol polyprotein [Gossypium australe]|uniref:Transposon Ty3-G Gag-Pol polyprotein n=1 Tax=Gossypium australe TaxID=47621 RepID=A0A5B6VNG7_9ROSI|nr:Transposon Ty3-G Gag-Pol polyprotein [Gossypium australe]
MTLYEALYGHKCWTLLYWTEISENKIHGIDLIREAEEKVKKSYDIEFQIGDRVFLKVSSWKKILRFGYKGKLSLRFIGPYGIIERMGPVAYQLPLLSKLEKIHNVFHLSMLHQYRSDSSHVVSPAEIKIQPDISYSEEPIKLLA